MTDKPSCTTCPYMRFEGNSMRCYYDPPLATALGVQPNRIQGLPPQLVIAGISPEVHPERFCRHHPLIANEGVVPEVVGSTPAKPNGGIIMPEVEQVQ
jgi:hypothetical protein